MPRACGVPNFSNRWLNGQASLGSEWCFIMFYHVLSNVKPKRSMSACSKVALIGKHIILIHFFDFPGRRKPPPRHASTPCCGVAMLTLEFEQLEVPCSERGRTHITFHCLSLRHSWTVKPDIQQVELILVVFFVGGCPCWKCPWRHT
mgnify:CR=1 FL=1